MFWTCARCGRAIGNEEWTAKGETEDEHICEECFFASMGVIE